MLLTRMTTRQWMLVAVVVACALGTRSEVERRRERYRQRADALEREALIARVELSIAAHPGTGCVVPNVDPKAAGLPVALEGYRRRVLYFQRLRDKYQRAARYPWLPVAHDPPEPESGATPDLEMGLLSAKGDMRDVTVPGSAYHHGVDGNRGGLGADPRPRRLELAI